MIELRAGDDRLLIDPEAGNYPSWQVDGVDVLHAAPWRDEPAVQGDDSLTPGIRRLAGDFLCMPFCGDDIGGDPAHGWPANSPWDVAEAGADAATLRLGRKVRGAAVTKTARLSPGALYQTHEITGGQGEVTLAHHPMARMAGAGWLSFSPKRAVLTDPTPQYAGRNLWALGQCRTDMRLACENGPDWDMHSYPKDHAVEDFAIFVEAPGAALGWTVLIREAEDDMLVVLKDPRQLPVTMMWVSNGGRDFSPWNSRHTGVIGIEDGIAAGATGLAFSQGPNPVRDLGVPTTLALGGRHVICHAMARLPRPEGWERVSNVALQGGALHLQEAGGATVQMPFDTGFFAP